MKSELIKKTFPIAVFGTLRSIPSDQGNSLLMFSRRPLAHKKCFIPHFLPNGIWLEFKKNSCGLAEIYFYDQKDWSFILEKIDKLEGFDQSKSKYGYHRTLMNIKLLPDDYADEMYDQGLRLKQRDLSIPREDWNFPSVAAWVYSNVNANNACKMNLKTLENPIIFD